MARFCDYCRKRIMKDEIEAKLALATRVKQDKGEVRFYRCPKGNGYHLTSKKYRRKTDG